MALTLAWLLTLALTSVSVYAENERPDLHWPYEYYLKGIQRDILKGVVEPFQIWNSLTLRRSRIDTFNSAVQKYYYNKEGYIFEKSPVLSTENESPGKAKPLCLATTNRKPLHHLPEFMPERPVFLKKKGTKEWNGIQVDVWCGAGIVEDKVINQTLYIIPYTPSIGRRCRRSSKYGDIPARDEVIVSDAKSKEVEYHVVKQYSDYKYDIDQAELTVQGDECYFFKRQYPELPEYDDYKNLFKRKSRRHHRRSRGVSRRVQEASAEDLPAALDLRVEGLVTPVGYQGVCNSGWAFAITTAIEGSYAKQEKNLLKLSEQSLIDCAWNFDVVGCEGADLYDALEYAYVTGLPTELEYGQYTGLDGFCKLSELSKVSVKINDIYNTTKDNYPVSVKTALFVEGPVIASVFNKMETYTSGLYKDDSCDGVTFTHAVAIVGYGSYNGEEYWLVKNSLGTDWGVAGYGLIPINDNKCLSSDFSYVSYHKEM